MKRIISLSVIFMMVLSVLIVSPLSAKAIGDSNTLELRSFGFSKSGYVSGEDVVVTVTAYAESGISASWSTVGLKNTNSPGMREINMGPGTLISKDDTNCLYTLQYNLSVNDHLGTGTYYIYRISLMDSSNIRIGYCVEATQGPNKINKETAEVTNTARTDFTAPVLKSVDVDKTSANVGESLTYTIGATDDSGVRNGTLFLKDPQGKLLYDDIELYPDTSDPEQLKGTFTVKASYQPGNYSIYCIVLYDNWDNEMYYEYYHDGLNAVLPENMNKGFTIVNPDYNAGPPTVENVTFTKTSPNTGDAVNITSAKPGDIVHISADIKDNGSGIKNVQLYFDPIASSVLCCAMYLTKDTDGKYVCDWTVPANLQSCSFSLAFYIFKEDSTDQQYFGSCNNYTFPIFNITSAFSGLDSKSVLTGSVAFDPLTGVTASNDSEGEMTNKIKVYGNVDNTKAGLYLLRYRIESSQINPDGSGGNLYYYKSRWIGVTDTMPDTSNPNAPLSLTSGSLQIGAESSDVSVQKDGQAINYSGLYSTPGVYTVSESSSSQAQSKSVSAMSAGSGLKATAVIDRSAPDITATWKVSSSQINVTVKASDVSGIASLKYMPGVQTLEECKNNGADFIGSFIASNSGKYTVYSRDNLKNEGIKIFDIGQKYTVHLSAGSGAKVTPSKITVTSGDTYGTLPTPTRSGYYFCGWYTEASGTGSLVKNTNTVEITNDITLYAKWAKGSNITLSTPSLSVKATGYNAITLSWKAVKNAQGYEIYRSAGNAKKFSLLTTTSDGSLSYADTAITTGTKYYYKIRAYCVPYIITVYSGYSSSKYVKTVPNAASGLTLKLSGTAITVSWSAAGGATGYEVYRATSAKGKYKMIKATTDLNLNDTGLTAGKTYYYKVRSYCMVGKIKIYGGYTSVSSLKI